MRTRNPLVLPTRKIVPKKIPSKKKQKQEKLLDKEKVQYTKGEV